MSVLWLLPGAHQRARQHRGGCAAGRGGLGSAQQGPVGQLRPEEPAPGRLRAAARPAVAAVGGRGRYDDTLSRSCGSGRFESCQWCRQCHGIHAPSAESQV
eukprot:SAG22_NODE_337_length_12043_cov_58.339556_4_plen_101_part_00